MAKYSCDLCGNGDDVRQVEHGTDHIFLCKECFNQLPDLFGDIREVGR